MFDIIRFIRFDWILFVSLALVMAFGCAVVYSASGGSEAVLIRQLIRIGVSMALMLVVAQLPMSFWRTWVVVFFILGLVLLVIVLFFGAHGKGAERWIDLGFMRFQPSELMKITLPLILARFISSTEMTAKSQVGFIGVLLSLFLIGLVFCLIVLQPDLGTAILIAFSGLFVLFLASLPWLYIFSALTIIMVSIPLIWQNVLHDYQKGRILTFLDPERDPLGSGYHIIQSKISIGSGGTFGKGFMQGSQSQLNFLPERTTDFIFSVMSEEFGFMGFLVLLGLYFLIIARCLWITHYAQNQFNRLIAGALTFTFVVYIVVNMGMVSGLLPVVGLPLPLVSYGGTSMLTIMVGFGILMSIRQERRIQAYKKM